MQGVKDYIETSRALQEKYEEIKHGIVSQWKILEEQYKPITDSLQVLGTQMKKNTSAQVTSTNREKERREIMGETAFNYLCKTPSTERDCTFGVKINNGKTYLGAEQIIIQHNTIYTKGKSFQGTEGLWRLLTLKEPNDFTENDLNMYENLVLITHTYRHNNDPENPSVKSSQGNKYKKIIQPMLIRNGIIKSKSEAKVPTIEGSGLCKVLTNAPVEYVYWNTLEELLERLYIVYGELKSGNNNPTLVNEIVNILQEIREI